MRATLTPAPAPRDKSGRLAKGSALASSATHGKENVHKRQRPHESHTTDGALCWDWAEGLRKTGELENWIDNYGTDERDVEERESESFTLEELTQWMEANDKATTPAIPAAAPMPAAVSKVNEGAQSPPVPHAIPLALPLVPPQLQAQASDAPAAPPSNPAVPPCPAAEKVCGDAPDASERRSSERREPTPRELLAKGMCPVSDAAAAMLSESIDRYRKTRHMPPLHLALTTQSVLKWRPYVRPGTGYEDGWLLVSCSRDGIEPHETFRGSVSIGKRKIQEAHGLSSLTVKRPPPPSSMDAARPLPQTSSHDACASKRLRPLGESLEAPRLPLHRLPQRLPPPPGLGMAAAASRLLSSVAPAVAAGDTLPEMNVFNEPLPRFLLGRQLMQQQQEQSQQQQQQQPTLVRFAHDQQPAPGTRAASPEDVLGRGVDAATAAQFLALSASIMKSNSLQRPQPSA